MNKIEAFQQAMKKITNAADVQYISDPNNWCVVHATRYAPKRGKNGKYYIPSTAMATDFEQIRTTVHTTFNHVVKSVGFWSWDDMPTVILAPYRDIVHENGNPAQVALMDTYWSVNPERGLVLPDNAYIIRPSNETLFEIGANGATYKRDNYTPSEIDTILKMLPASDLEKYQKYENANFQDYDVEKEFYADERVKKMYDLATDKRAFLRGLFEESKYDILSHFLRDAVTKIALEKNGYRVITETLDGGPNAVAVSDAATKMGLESTSSNKGHSLSIYSEMELGWGRLMDALTGGFDKYGILNAPDLRSLYDYMALHQDNDIMKQIAQNIIRGKKVNFMDLYEKMFMENIQSKIFWLNNESKYFNQELSLIPQYQITKAEKTQRETELLENHQLIQRQLKQLEQVKKISDFDKNFSETLARNATRLSREYGKWFEQLKNEPQYLVFVNQLKLLFEQKTIQHNLAERARG